MTLSADQVTRIKNKPEDYALPGSKSYLLDLDDHDSNKIDVAQSYEDAENQRFSSLPIVDTIASAKSAEEGPSTEQTDLIQPKTFSFATIVDLGKKFWEWISSPFTSKKAIEPVTGKAPDEAVQGISGTPSLQSPAHVNHEMIQKMIQELQEQVKRIEESTNETNDQNLTDEKRYVLHYLIQYQIRKDGIANIQFQFIFNQQRDHEIRKEQSDLKGQKIEIDKSRKFWSAVNTGIAVAAVATLIAAMAISVITTYGLTVTAIPAAITVGVKIIGSSLAIAGGGTAIIKGGLDKEHGEFQGKIELLNYKHKSLNETLRNESFTTNSEYNKALENWGMLKQMLDNMHKTSRVLTSK